MTAVLFALLALAIQQAVPPEPAPAADVQVIGRKLKDWRAKLTSSKGVYRCKIRRSTGDAEIDAIGCAAMKTCLPRFEPRLIAVAERKLGAAARKEAEETISREMTVCMMGEHDRLIEELAERRYRLRSETAR